MKRASGVKLSLIIVGVKMSSGLKKLHEAVQRQVGRVKMSRTRFELGWLGLTLVEVRVKVNAFTP